MSESRRELTEEERVMPPEAKRCTTAVWEDGAGGPLFVWVCEQCGQPGSPKGLCNSGLHVGPGEQANGKFIKSTELAERVVPVSSEPDPEDPLTVWTCMSCGHIAAAQSCDACGCEAMPGKWIRADEPPARPVVEASGEREASQKRLIDRLTMAAISRGYALAVHGSRARDLDVIAVPWVETAASEADLLRAFEDAEFIVQGPNQSDEAKENPFGRRSWVLQGVPGSAAVQYVDLSITPRAASTRVPDEAAQDDVARFLFKLFYPTLGEWVPGGGKWVAEQAHCNRAACDLVKTLPSLAASRVPSAPDRVRRALEVLVALKMVGLIPNADNDEALAAWAEARAARDELPIAEARGEDRGQEMPHPPSERCEGEAAPSQPQDDRPLGHGHSAPEQFCGAQDWGRDEDGEVVIDGTCGMPAGHEGNKHHDFSKGEVWHEWHGPADSRAPVASAPEQVERAVDALRAYDACLERYGGLAAASNHGIARTVLDAVSGPPESDERPKVHTHAPRVPCYPACAAWAAPPTKEER